MTHPVDTAAAALERHGYRVRIARRGRSASEVSAVRRHDRWPQHALIIIGVAAAACAILVATGNAGGTLFLGLLTLLGVYAVTRPAFDATFCLYDGEERWYAEFAVGQDCETLDASLRVKTATGYPVKIEEDAAHDDG